MQSVEKYEDETHCVKKNGGNFILEAKSTCKVFNEWSPKDQDYVLNLLGGHTKLSFNILKGQFQNYKQFEAVFGEGQNA